MKFPQKRSLMPDLKILVVDDEEEIRISLQEILDEEGYDVAVAANAAEAREQAAMGSDCALVDIRIGEDNGIELLRHFRENRPHMPVIMISGHGTISLTSEAFKLGAHDFLEKPLRLIQIRASVRNALEAARLKHEVSEHAKAKYPMPIYKSEIMVSLYQQVDRLAKIPKSVVITGPTGSGKELVAQALHFEGARSDGPFVATNTASMPLSLAEDELFGHEKGAFTGAHAKRIGCLEQADGGTLFLDEIADMDLQVQAKLLRVLETGQLTRLGGNKPININVRIVAATHKNLDALVKEGAFRHDLWYRLCAFILHVPPLAERTQDIPLLAQAFLASVCKEMQIIHRFSDDALVYLASKKYPGNIRELKHVVTRAAVFANDEEIGRSIVESVAGGLPSNAENARLSGTPASNYGALDFKSAREQFEKEYFNSVLEKNSGNITATAASIGMAQSNLSRKLKELHLR
ncbi:MAG: response regulator [Chitinivibrionales bacterium]|nr:response regulator [Chitinivibrionales bacterium]